MESTEGPDENVRIFSTEDEKIKSLGSILTNDSSRSILQILLTDVQSASQLAARTDLSLPLVVYHLNKMQELDVIKIARIDTNSKGQDMKYYAATKFAIVILPSTVSKKASGSKSLLRSFQSIYRFAGIGIAGAAAWLATAGRGPSGGTTVESVYQSALPSGEMQMSDLSSEMQMADSAPKDTLQTESALESTEQSVHRESGEDTDAFVKLDDVQSSPSSAEPASLIESTRIDDEILLENAAELAEPSGMIEIVTRTAEYSWSIPPEYIVPAVITITVIAVGLFVELGYRTWRRSKQSHQEMQ